MKSITDHKLSSEEASLWWLGQAGYVLKSMGIVIAIDPYLSDAAAEGSPEFSRLYPPPIQPENLEVSIYIVTHDHLDHLDPVTIMKYQNRDSTIFIAPRQAAAKLMSLGVAKENLVILHAGESWRHKSVEVTGVFAIATSTDVLDTTGYFLKFDNGRSFYHTSDTEYHPMVVAAAPRNPEVMVVPINGKWGNPNPDDAVQFAKTLRPRFVMPNHYDLMALNAENPEIFKWFCVQNGMKKQCTVLSRMKPFVWGKE